MERDVINLVLKVMLFGCVVIFAFELGTWFRDRQRERREDQCGIT